MEYHSAAQPAGGHWRYNISGVRFQLKREKKNRAKHASVALLCTDAALVVHTAKCHLFVAANETEKDLSTNLEGVYVYWRMGTAESLTD